MQFSAKFADPVAAPTDCIVVGVFQGKKPQLTPATMQSVGAATGSANLAENCMGVS